MPIELPKHKKAYSRKVEALIEEGGIEELIIELSIKGLLPTNSDSCGTSIGQLIEEYLEEKPTLTPTTEW